MNEVAGPLMRTKPASCNEGGVAIGIGVMDSVVFDKEKWRVKRSDAKRTEKSLTKNIDRMLDWAEEEAGNLGQ